MIKLFRNIRLKLLTEGKTSNYLKYAIGEIVLVVFGILIALQINNWNEDRIARKQEVKYLRNLQADLNLELINNDRMIAYRLSKANAALKLFQYQSPKEVAEAREFEKILGLVIEWVAFIPINNTYKELVSSGNFQFITSDSIKNQLMELDKLYSKIDIYEHHMRREYEQYLYDMVIPNTDAINFMNFDSATDAEKLTETDRPQALLDKLIPQYDWLAKNTTFKNGLKLAVANNMGLKVTHFKIKDHLNRLLKQIDQDLKK